MVLTVDDCCGQDGCHAGLLGQELDVSMSGGQALRLHWLLLHGVAGGAVGLCYKECAQQSPCWHWLGEPAPEGFICKGKDTLDGRASSPRPATPAL